jgi:hypothetical protein
LRLEVPEHRPFEQRTSIPNLSCFFVTFLHRKPKHAVEERVEHPIGLNG